MPLPPKVDPVSPAAAARAVIEAAIEDNASVRLHVTDPAAPAGLFRVVEGAVQAIVTGRDGRDRVLIQLVGDASDNVEVRLPIERVLRAERVGSQRQQAVATRRVGAVGSGSGGDE